MEEKKKMTVRSRRNAFIYAFRGIQQVFRNEPNAKIHTLATIVVIVAGIVLHISAMRWAALLIAIGMVWTTELLNTAIEEICDMYTKEYDPMVKKIKDLAAGAVLVASIVSVGIGIIVFFF